MGLVLSWFGSKQYLRMKRKTLLVIFVYLCVVGCRSEDECGGACDPWEADTSSDTNPDDLPVIIVNAHHVRNPYGAAPLVAAIIVSGTHVGEAPSEIHVHVHEQGENQPGFTEYLYPQTDAYQANFDMSDLVEPGEVAVPVLGLYPYVTNTVYFRVYTDDAVSVGEVEIPVSGLSQYAEEQVTIHTADTATMEPGWTSMGGRIYDNYGNMRWIGHVIFQLLENGNFIDDSMVDERSLLGKVVVNRSKDLPAHFVAHHDAIELPSGNILACVTNENTSIVNWAGNTTVSKEDYIIEVDYESSLIVNAWDMREFLDVSRGTVNLAATDWLHMNTLYYDDTDDSLIISTRYQGMMKVTRGGIQGEEPNAGKTMNWILSPHLDWGMAGFDGQGDFDPNEYLLTAVDSNGLPYPEDVQFNLAAPDENGDPFHWPIGQHGIEITSREDGKLRFITFNNQASIVFDGEGSVNNQLYGDTSNDRAEFPYSAMIEYEVDEEAMTVRQLWSFGEEVPDYFCSLCSCVDLLPTTGHYLMGTCGGDALDLPTNPFNPHILELDANGDVIFHLEMNNSDHVLYRSKRIQMYHPEQSSAEPRVSSVE